VPISDLEAHVEQHFEDEEAKRVSKPGEKPISKTEAKAGFFAKIFGTKTEEEKKPANTDTQTTPAATPTQAAAQANNQNTNAVPYTHTAPYRYYPGMTGSPAPAMYRPTYYPYPAVQQPRQGMAPNGQQYLYYPNLDQPPQ